MHDPAAMQAKLNHWLRQRGCQNFLTCLVADRAVLVATMLAPIAELNGKAAHFSFALHLGGLVMLPLHYLESLLLLASAGPP